jgi:uncharacterized protein YebE (UPF0316 family)
MTLDLTPDALLLALLLFVMRFLNLAIFTVRLIMMSRQRRHIAAALGFIESIVFAVTITAVVTDLGNVLNLLAYASGFSLGSFAGMWIESRFITSYKTLDIIARERGHELALALRDAGFGVTETWGEGLDGEVVMLRSTVMNYDVDRLTETIHQINDTAFIAVENTRLIHRGYIRAVNGQPTGSGVEH